MATRRIVELEDAVDRALGVVAESRNVSIEELLAAAARHVARTMGGLREPRYRLRAADPEIPTDVDVVPASPVSPVPLGPAPKPRYLMIGLSQATLAQAGEVVKLYRDELLTLRQVAERVHMSTATVRRVLEHENVTVRPRGWVPGRNLGGERVAS